MTERGETIVYKAEKYSGSREEQYALLVRQLEALLAGETNAVANLANASALFNQFFTEINWVGFYLMEDEELVLGPFQGLPACVRIPVGKGVCGTAVREGRTIIVPDVHEFPGHIACDAASRSEIVVPIRKDGRIIGVLDIDSPVPDRFDETDRIGLEKAVEALAGHLGQII